MNSNAFSFLCEQSSFFRRGLAAVAASFPRSSKGKPIAALAASLATELRSTPGIAEQVIRLSSVPQRERRTALLRAAHSFREDWSTFGVADSLRRLTRPDLFRAVIRELQAQPSSSQSPRFVRDYFVPQAA